MTNGRSTRTIRRIDHKRHTVFFTDGSRQGFAQARRNGIDVEAAQADATHNRTQEEVLPR